MMAHIKPRGGENLGESRKTSTFEPKETVNNARLERFTAVGTLGRA
jgi:hypothetical protein